MAWLLGDNPAAIINAKRKRPDIGPFCESKE
jgi:hypothetical protein